MTTTTIYFLYIIGAIIGWIIFYYVVKAAVRNGIKEARCHKEVSTNAEQNLQQRYHKGEITFEDYQSAWNKLARS